MVGEDYLCLILKSHYYRTNEQTAKRIDKRSTQGQTQSTEQ